MMTVSASGFRIAFTHHAIVRYRERVRQGLGHAAAAGELAKVVSHARVMPGPPVWLGETRGHADLHLVVGDVAFPLRRDASAPGLLWAMTCIVRNGVRKHVRERRNASSRRRRGGRRCPRQLRLAAEGEAIELEHRYRHPSRRASSLRRG